MSAVGWIEISPGALRRLQRGLERDQERGVVDEIGALTFHETYADRFFPGTSVLHRRARYLLFVPWAYLYLARQRYPAAKLDHHRRRVFRMIVKALKADPKAVGIIGRDVHDAAQPPDVVYWNALRQYGICSDIERSTVLRRWDPNRVGRTREQVSSEEPRDSLLVEFYVPPAPTAWPKPPFTFRLQKEEAHYLRDVVATLEPPNLLSEAARSLRKNDGPGESTQWLWDDAFMARVAKKLGPETERAVARAKHVAHLAELGRAVYATHVERMCCDDVVHRRRKNKKPKSDTSYEQSLRALVEGRTGLTLAARADFERDVGAPQLGQAGLALFQHLREQASRVRSWSDARAKLLDRHTRGLLENAEYARKGSRARLATVSGRSRRASFDWGDVAIEPLHYRWRVARRLLLDLREGLYG